MKISDKILLILKDSPKTIKEIRKDFPNKDPRILSATISNNQHLFLRLDKALIGLKNRDEHLMKDWRKQGLPLYKKMVNCLQDGSKTINQLYNLLPEEKKKSIRATVNINPQLFIRITKGIIGRKNRDEHLIKQHEKPSVRGERRKRYEKITKLLETILQDSPKTIEQIKKLLPELQTNTIIFRLQKGEHFERDEEGCWGMK